MLIKLIIILQEYTNYVIVLIRITKDTIKTLLWNILISSQTEIIVMSHSFYKLDIIDKVNRKIVK